MSCSSILSLEVKQHPVHSLQNVIYVSQITWLRLSIHRIIHPSNFIVANSSQILHRAGISPESDQISENIHGVQNLHCRTGRRVCQIRRWSSGLGAAARGCRKHDRIWVGFGEIGDGWGGVDPSGAEGAVFDPQVAKRDWLAHTEICRISEPGTNTYAASSATEWS